MMFITMEILRVASLFLLFCFYSVFSFPSRPLNERSTELAWQAWLLVDDQQNQHKNSPSENIPRRRITPKSVFIAPTFSPESLPACADGYRPDSMGRCIKIIKLDEEAHLEFLLEKLNAQFGNYDEMEEDTQENGEASGPFQLNIPLNGPQDGPPKQVDIAIVVAPTNGNFGSSDAKTTTVAAITNLLENLNIQKTVPPPNEENQPEETNYTKRQTETVIATTKKHTEITNIDTTLATTTSYKTMSTIIEELPETSTFVSSTASSDFTTTNNTEETTVIDQHALFFLQPPLTNSEHVQNTTWNANDAPMAMITDNYNKTPSNDSLKTLSNSTFIIDASINLNNKGPLLGNSFKATESTTIASELNTDSDPAHSSAGLVRFPTDDPTTSINYIRFPGQVSTLRILPHLQPTSTPEQKVPSSNSDQLKPIYQTVFKGYLNPNGSNSLKGNGHFIFKDVTNVPVGNPVSDPLNRNHNIHANYSQMFNHRNRDKNTNFWSIPSSWRQSSPKPIVLRFSRRGISSRRLLSEQFAPQTQNSQTFYREVPSEEFSYLFGHDKNYSQKQNPR